MDQELGEKIAQSGVSWLEVVVRVAMVVVHVAMGGVFILIMLSVFGGNTLALICLAGIGLYVLLSGAILIPGVARTLWQMPRLEIFERGIRFTSRQRQETWTWDQLDKFEYKEQFGIYFVMTFVVRVGQFVVYRGEESVLNITPMYANARRNCEHIENYIRLHHPIAPAASA